MFGIYCDGEDKSKTLTTKNPARKNLVMNSNSCYCVISKLSSQILSKMNAQAITKETKVYIVQEDEEDGAQKLHYYQSINKSV